MSKEQVYDDQISPLMAQILKTCKENKIAMVFSFQLDDADDDNGPMYCDSKILTDDCEPSDHMMKLGAMVGPRKANPLTMMTVRGGDGKVKEMHAFL